MQREATRVSKNRPSERGEKTHPGLVSISKVNGSAFVQDKDFVKDVVRGLGRLVDGDAGGRVVERDGALDGSTEGDGSSRVESSGGVVEEIQRSVGEGDLGDGDSLSPGNQKGWLVATPKTADQQGTLTVHQILRDGSRRRRERLVCPKFQRWPS